MTPSDISTVCPCCREPISAGVDEIRCPQCGSAHHRECWEHTRGCRNVACSAIQPAVPSSLAAVEPSREHIHWLIALGVIIVLVVIGMLAVSRGVPLNSVLIIGVVIAALTFDYVNGMHDAGNAIATVISTRVLPPTTALFMAAVMNLLGAMVYAGVATSIATKFADMSRIVPSDITPVMILCGLVGASAWSYLTARLGLPVSTSHSLFGGLIGVFMLGGIPLNMSYLSKIGLFMVLAPVMAFSVGWVLMVILMWIFRHAAPHKVNRHFRVWQMLSSALMAFSHGSNDAQKAMGIITLALVSGGFIHLTGGASVVVPFWVKLACAIVIALGTAFGGMRVIKTLGHKIIKLDPIHGFTAETVAAFTIQLVTFLHVPISTTHVISSSILGIGASKRLSAVRWGIAQNIVVAWVFTIPTCAIAGALLYALVKTVFRIH